MGRAEASGTAAVGLSGAAGSGRLRPPVQSRTGGTGVAGRPHLDGRESLGGCFTWNRGGRIVPAMPFCAPGSVGVVHAAGWRVTPNAGPTWVTRKAGESGLTVGER